jgi:hypothetical protein
MPRIGQTPRREPAAEGLFGAPSQQLQAGPTRQPFGVDGKARACTTASKGAVQAARRGTPIPPSGGMSRHPRARADALFGEPSADPSLRRRAPSGARRQGRPFHRPSGRRRGRRQRERHQRAALRSGAAEADDPRALRGAEGSHLTHPRKRKRAALGRLGNASGSRGKSLNGLRTGQGAPPGILRNPGVEYRHRERAWDEAQGSNGHFVGGNADGAQRTSQRSKALRSSDRREAPSPDVATRTDWTWRTGSNGERVSERGDAPRPAEKGNASKGEAQPGKPSKRPQAFGRGRRARSGNVANPMAGSRVQQTCRVSSGVNRRSREERQGRKEHGVWQLRAEGRALAHPGQDARHLYWRRGDL